MSKRAKAAHGRMGKSKSFVHRQHILPDRRVHLHGLDYKVLPMVPVSNQYPVSSIPASSIQYPGTLPLLRTHCVLCYMPKLCTSPVAWNGPTRLRPSGYAGQAGQRANGHTD